MSDTLWKQRVLVTNNKEERMYEFTMIQVSLSVLLVMIPAFFKDQVQSILKSIKGLHFVIEEDLKSG